MILFLSFFYGKFFVSKFNIKDDADEGSAAVPLEMANVAGVFYVLCGGSIFASIFAFIVVLFETLRLSKEMKVRFFKRKKKSKRKIICPKK